MNSSPSLLIVGCGYLGQKIAQHWHADGGQVYGTTRSLVRAAELKKNNIHPIIFDLDHPETSSTWPEVDFGVISIAASSASNSSYETVYQNGVSTIVKALSQINKLKFLLYTSSVGVYSQSSGECVNETSATSIESSRKAALLAAEQAILGGVIPSTIYRLAGIYGPQRNRLRAVHSRVGVEAPTNFVNLIHVEDAALSSIYLLKKQCDKEIVIGVDDCPVKRGDLVSWLAGRLKIEIPPYNDKVTSARSGQNKQCSNLKLKSLGYNFVFPTYKEGYENLLTQESEK